MNLSANDTLVMNVCYSASCLLSPGATYFIILLLFLLFVASLVGNILILVLLSKDHQLRARSSPSHISLAVADLLATIFWLPVLIIDIFIVDKWLFGAVICRLVSFFQFISIASSSLNLCIVTAECFAAVWFPFFLKVLPRKRTILISSCTVAWFIAFIDSMVYVQFKMLKTFDGDDYCTESWPNKITEKIFLYVNQCLFSFGPLITITILNILCIYRLCQSNTLGSRRRHSKGGTHTRSATKKIVTISLIFVICRSPYHIFEMVMHNVGYHLVSPQTHIIVYTLVIGLYFFSATTHPVLFGLMSVYYREAFKRSCPCYVIRGNRRSSTSKSSGQTTKIMETIF